MLTMKARGTSAGPCRTIPSGDGRRRRDSKVSFGFKGFVDCRGAPA